MKYTCLEQVQNNLMRAFLGMGKTAPIAGLAGEMNRIEAFILVYQI